MKNLAVLFTVSTILFSLCACSITPLNPSQHVGQKPTDKSNYTDNIELDEGPVPGAYTITPITEVPDGYVGIYTIEDLLRIESNTAMNYILMEDLDLSSYSNWAGLSNDAHFNGNGHIISNLRSQKSGLFDKCKEISGLILENVEIEFDSSHDERAYYDYYLGSIANTVKGSIMGCSATGYISIKGLHEDTVGDFYIGGMVGYAQNSMISSCTNDISVLYNTNETGEGYISVVCGGIVGLMKHEKNTGSISGCVNNAEIYAYAYTEKDDAHWIEYQGVCGGIVGEITPNVTIDMCTNFGDITGSVIASGIVATTKEGHYDKTFVVSDCINAGKIEISKKEGRVYPTYDLGHKAAGIIGELHNSSLSMYTCYSFGEICGDFEDAGSLIAHSETDKIYIKDCICIDNSDYNESALSMDGKDGMYPENYKNKEISLVEAKKRFSEYFDN